ncbi:Cyclopropane-fatty-acyl-phospholipid synthase [Gossypium australe]|uniref:Cyclopropane-fatty-acyl-phospholipid synthase n=1 Tax=Gossypium australe TaxID=47621 RepID=A0A5B6W5J6_9ROSI|nr:Cyclopropane-fatty-acyl-phospholipid synthase [Gossypium australe]
MLVFLTSKGVIEEMQTKISRVWWSGKDRGRVWTMLSWKKLCYSKGMRGLGFRDLYLFNLALIGRQYFPDGNIFNFKKVDKTSFTYRSIAAAASVLKSGFGWQLGCGDRINIHSDN